MKPQLHNLPSSIESSFQYNKWNFDHFDKSWHVHKEYELVMINKSSGTKIIGNNVSNFEEGDLSLIGSNIPHLFRNNEKYYAKNKMPEAGSIFIHFTKDFLGNDFLHLPEMKLVNRMLDKSGLAHEIHGSTKTFTINKLQDMHDETPPQRLLSLLEILIRLSQSNELKPLLSGGFTGNNNGDSDKINKALEFILKNYTKEIYVHEIASKLNMSIAAFSRYFKKYTRKTFSDYVTEIRIGHSCRLLMENNLNISEICYQSGFANLSNFYRHFLKLVGIIPKEYRNRFLQITN